MSFQVRRDVCGSEMWIRQVIAFNGRLAFRARICSTGSRDVILER
jgi:hypothetical protein